MAASWDEKNRRGLLYVNGIKNGYNNVDANYSSYRARNNSHILYHIGSQSKEDADAGGKTLHGLVKELKVFKKALNSSEILTEARMSNMSGTSDRRFCI